MHSFDNTTRLAKKKDNWGQIKLILQSINKKDIIKNVNVDDLIQNTNGAALAFVKSLYTMLAQKALPEMPKIASIKDKSAAWEGTFILKDKELVKLTDQEDDFFKTEEGKAEKESIPSLLSCIEEKVQPTVQAKEEAPTNQARSIRLPKGPQKAIEAEPIKAATSVPTDLNV